MNHSFRKIIYLALCIAASSGGCPSQNRPIVTIFHAASLSPFLEALGKQIQPGDLRIELCLEPSGSQVAARKVSELHRTADLVMVADKNIIDAILIPKHASSNLVFATNEIVLAHAQHSRYTDRVHSGNWFRILQKPDVRFGRANEHLAPIGYQTLHALHLAQMYYGQEHTGKDLAARLKNRCKPEHITPDVGELITLLQARVLDYAFVFRSLAERHNLKFVRLPEECNLSNPQLNHLYSQATTQVRMKSNQEPVKIHGEAIQFSLAIPKNARNPAGARKVIDLLLGPFGRDLLRRYGFHPLNQGKSEATGVVPPQPTLGDNP